MNGAQRSDGPQADPDQVAPEFRIVSKNTSAAEVAAVTAVLRAALAEQAASLELESGGGRSAWARRQRPIRAALEPHTGWRGFSG